MPMQGLGVACLIVRISALSPETYSCDLCALTHGFWGAKQQWQTFLDRSDVSFSFLHRNDDYAALPVSSEDLPAILLREESNAAWQVLITQNDWGRFADLDALIVFLNQRLPTTKTMGRNQGMDRVMVLAFPVILLALVGGLIARAWWAPTTTRPEVSVSSGTPWPGRYYPKPYAPPMARRYPPARYREAYTMVFFSASWCSACRELAPTLKDYVGHDNFSHHANIILAAVENDEGRIMTISHFTPPPCITLPLVMKRLSDTYVFALPTIMLIDQTGQPVFTGPGINGGVEPARVK